jgi:hypothetical protein
VLGIVPFPDAKARGILDAKGTGSPGAVFYRDESESLLSYNFGIAGLSCVAACGVEEIVHMRSDRLKLGVDPGSAWLTSSAVVTAMARHVRHASQGAPSPPTTLNLTSIHEASE